MTEDTRPEYPPMQADREGTAVVPWLPAPGEMAAVVTTLDLVEDAKKIIRCMNDTMPVTALAEKSAKIVDIIVHLATVLNDETGEYDDVKRTVLISDKGVNYASMSGGVLGSIKQISAIYGPPPWDPPLDLEMIEKQTRKGRRTYILIPV